MNLLNLRGNFNTFYYLNLLDRFSVFVKKIKLFHEIIIVLITIHSIKKIFREHSVFYLSFGIVVFKTALKCRLT